VEVEKNPVYRKRWVEIKDCGCEGRPSEGQKA
jgi:hypothetical protein